MKYNSFLQILKSCFTGAHIGVSLTTREMVKTIKKKDQKSLEHFKSFFNRFLSASRFRVIKFLRKCNNQLNIYTELKRNYNIQNNQEETRIYLHVVYNGSQNSITKFLIISEQYNNQLNFFNC